MHPLRSDERSGKDKLQAKITEISEFVTDGCQH